MKTKQEHRCLDFTSILEFIHKVYKPPIPNIACNCCIIDANRCIFIIIICAMKNHFPEKPSKSHDLMF